MSVFTRHYHIGIMLAAMHFIIYTWEIMYEWPKYVKFKRKEEFMQVYCTRSSCWHSDVFLNTNGVLWHVILVFSRRKVTWCTTHKTYWPDRQGSLRSLTAIYNLSFVGTKYGRIVLIAMINHVLENKQVKLWIAFLTRWWMRLVNIGRGGHVGICYTQNDWV